MNILIAGDFAPRARLAKQIDERKYGDIFSEDLRRIISSADFSIVNFESPVAGNNFKPITKCGPNLRCTPNAVEALGYAGFSAVTMANNHILDYGADGLLASVDCCKKAGIETVGAGSSLDEAEKILYFGKGNGNENDNDSETLAVINCCEHEFSIATETSAGANPLNAVRQYRAIQEARRHANRVLVIVHGGHEHFQLPSPRMQEIYRFFIDAGADAVVNHHQHCFSGYEEYKGKYIFYGLGNFSFDTLPRETNSSWNEGFMLQLNFGEQTAFQLYPYSQYAEHATIELLPENAFSEKLAELNHIIADRALLRTHVEDYYNRCSKSELSLFEPYRGRVLGKLYRMGLLPSFVRGKKLTAILNHIACEAHRDKMTHALQNKI